MKYSVKFPYNVFKLSSLKIESTHTNNYYGYKLKLPDVVFSKSGLGDTGEISKSNLSLVAEINCSATMYRKCFHSNNPNLNVLEFKVPKEKVSKNFAIDIIIVAKNPFGFTGQKIKKGMPVAHLGSYPVKLSESQKGLIEFETSETKSISYSLIGNTIKIRLPQKEYESLSRMRNQPEIRHLLASQFAQVALLEACRFLRPDSGRDHLLWHRELQKQWMQFDETGEEFPDEEDHIKLVNYILKEPSLKFAQYLIKEVKNRRDE